MRSKSEILNCKESFERQIQICKNEETKNMFRVLSIFCDLILNKRDHMLYPGFNTDNIDEEKLHYFYSKTVGVPQK